MIKYFYLLLLLSATTIAHAQIEIVQQTGHKSGITALAISPDGRYLATAEYYNPRLFIWDIHTRKKVLDFPVFKDLVDVVFSPDGQWVYGLTVYNSLFRYDLSGTQDTSFHYEQNLPGWAVNNKSARIDWGDEYIAYSENTSELSGGQEMEGMSFNMKEQILRLESLDGEIITLANEEDTHNQASFMDVQLSSDDKVLAAFRNSGLLEVWDTQKRSMLASILLPEVNRFYGNMKLALNEKKQMIYIGATGWNSIYSFDYVNQQLDSLDIQDIEPTTLYFNEQGQQLMIGTTESQLLVWDVEEASIKSRHVIPGKRAITTIALLTGKKDEYYIATGADIYTYSSTYNISLPFTRQLNLASPFDVDISMDGRLVMAYDTTVNVLDLSSGKTVNSIFLDRFVFFNQLSPDEKSLIVATDSTISKYRWPDLHKEWEKEHPLGRPRRIYFSPNSKLVNLVAKNKAMLYEVADGTIFNQLPAEQLSKEQRPYWIIGGTIDDEGNMIAISPESNSGTLQYWMKDFHKPLNALSYESHGPVRVYAAAPDQSQVTFAYPEGWKAYTFDLNKGGSTLIELEWNTCVAQYSHNSKMVATGSLAGNVKVYDAASRSLLHDIRAGSARVYNLIFSKDDRYLFANMQDGHLLMYDLEKEEVIGQVLLYYANALLITESAYYMGNKNILRSLGFKKDGQTFSFTQFDAQLNRPEKVIEQFGYGDTSVMAVYREIEQKRSGFLGTTAAYIEKSEAIPVVSLKNSQSIPLVSIRDQIDLELTYSRALEKAHRLHIWINGVPIYGRNGLEVQSEKALKLDLSQGQNLIELALESEGVMGVRTELQLWCKKEVESALYLLSIGVSDYQEEGQDLKYAAKDAKDLAQLYQQSKAFQKVHVKTLTDQAVNKKNIMAMKAWLDSTSVDDQVICFVSGHGLLDATKAFYYATHDVDFSDPSKNGVLYEEMEGLLDGIPARKKLLLIDACHSGEYDKEAEALTSVEQDSLKKKGIALNAFPKGDKTPVLGLQNSFEMMQQLFADLRRGSGASVITSSSGVQVSYEDGEWQNGAFTYALLYGLKSMRADANADGQVTTSELQDYLSVYVPRLTEGLQVPTFRQENLEYDFRVW
jgi:WD40 repeat protein/uncharacterized caspase-like protein